MKKKGRISGLNITEMWCLIFKLNAKTPKSKRLDDPTITKLMRFEFPESQAKYFDNVPMVRRQYDSGKLNA